VDLSNDALVTRMWARCAFVCTAVNRFFLLKTALVRACNILCASLFKRSHFDSTLVYPQIAESKEMAELNHVHQSIIVDAT
jgi:hypothetical protein